MQYYQQPDQDFGGGAYDDEQESKRRKPASPMMRQGDANWMRMPQPAAQPQTFSQMQKSGMARPPMPVAQPINGMRPMTSTGAPGVTMAPAAAGPITTTATPGKAHPWGTETAAPVAPPTYNTAGGEAGFDPMEWFRQQVLGGSQNVLERSQNYLGGQIDDDYDLREQRLREEMASRGLADSTVYGGRMQDLNVGRRSAKEGLGERLALEDLQRRTGMVDRMVGMDRDTQNYLLQLLGFGYGG